MRRIQNPVSRFWSKVDRAGDCWLWTGSFMARGYGLFSIRVATANHKNVLAHRLAYQLIKGPIAPGLTLDHLCRNRACVNPDHLEPVPIRENIMRGVGLTARQAAQTHCKRGHPLSGENLYLKPGKYGALRVCIHCRTEEKRARRAAEKRTS